MSTQDVNSQSTPAADEQGSSDLPQQFKVRADKRARLLEAGVDPYPVELPITTTIAQVREKHGELAAGTELKDDMVGLAGRVMYIRTAGKLCFATLQDGAGNRLQIMLSLANVGEEAFAAFKSDVDLGDHLFVHGHVGTSRRGELSVFAHEWRLASKAIRPLPKVYKNEDGQEVALSEEMRVRRRDLDLIMRPAARDMVRLRSAVVHSLRENFHERDFIEIETPMLQTIHGGAAARPFVTHMNAYDVDLYLRIAPELFLKRAVVGGLEKVFEINRNFRNEGADATHAPEFTMMECYEAYGTYDTMATLVMSLVQRAADEALGTQVVSLPDGSEYDLSGKWPELDLIGSLSESLGVEIDPCAPREELATLADKIGIEVEEHMSGGKLIEEMWEERVAPGLSAPTFVRNFPVETSPLTRGHRSRPGLTEKWDLYMRGLELATAYSELVDPVIQRERFEQQARVAAAGDDEAMRLDEDFLAAMEQGMPPAGGMGMGIDRLLTVFTGQNIRETILFPLVKRL